MLFFNIETLILTYEPLIFRWQTIEGVVLMVYLSMSTLYELEKYYGLDTYNQEFLALFFDVIKPNKFF